MINIMIFMPYIITKKFYMPNIRRKQKSIYIVRKFASISGFSTTRQSYH